MKTKPDFFIGAHGKPYTTCDDAVASHIAAFMGNMKGGWAKNWRALRDFLNAIEPEPTPLDKPADLPAGDRWVKWEGGNMPVSVSGDTLVEWKLRGGRRGKCAADMLSWAHMNDDFDIIAYRIVKEGE